MDDERITRAELHMAVVGSEERWKGRLADESGDAVVVHDSEDAALPAGEVGAIGVGGERGRGGEDGPQVVFEGVDEDLVDLGPDVDTVAAVEAGGGGVGAGVGGEGGRFGGPGAGGGVVELRGGASAAEDELERVRHDGVVDGDAKRGAGAAGGGLRDEVRALRVCVVDAGGGNGGGGGGVFEAAGVEQERLGGERLAEDVERFGGVGFRARSPSPAGQRVGGDVEREHAVQRVLVVVRLRHRVALAHHGDVGFA